MSKTITSTLAAMASLALAPPLQRGMDWRVDGGRPRSINAAERSRRRKRAKLAKQSNRRNRR